MLISSFRQSQFFLYICIPLFKIIGLSFSWKVSCLHIPIGLCGFSYFMPVNRSKGIIILILEGFTATVHEEGMIDIR